MKTFILSTLIVSVLLYSNIASADESPELISAPAFTLKDGNGESISLSDYQGKPIIIHFWATWCPYCKKLQPGLNRLAEKYQSDGLTIVAISFNEDEDAQPAAVFKQRGNRFDTLVDGDAVAETYQVTGTPTTVFINKQGQIIWRTMTSDPDNPALEKVVKYMLGKATE